MNMQDIPPEVFKWLFEQQKKGEEFAIFLTFEYVNLVNGREAHDLYHEYCHRRLFKYLEDIGYTKESEEEQKSYHDEMMDELMAEYDSSEDDDSPSDRWGLWDFLKRKGLLDNFYKSVSIFHPPEKDQDSEEGS